MQQMSKINDHHRSGIDLVFNTFDNLDKKLFGHRFAEHTEDEMYTAFLDWIFEKMLKNGWTPKAIRVAVEDEIGDDQSKNEVWDAYEQELRSKS